MASELIFTTYLTSSAISLAVSSSYSVPSTSMKALLIAFTIRSLSNGTRTPFLFFTCNIILKVLLVYGIHYILWFWEGRLTKIVRRLKTHDMSQHHIYRTLDISRSLIGKFIVWLKSQFREVVFIGGKATYDFLYVRIIFSIQLSQ